MNARLMLSPEKVASRIGWEVPETVRLMKSGALGPVYDVGPEPGQGDEWLRVRASSVETWLGDTP